MDVPESQAANQTLDLIPRSRSSRGDSNYLPEMRSPLDELQGVTGDNLEKRRYTRADLINEERRLKF